MCMRACVVRVSMCVCVYGEGVWVHVCMGACVYVRMCVLVHVCMRACVVRVCMGACAYGEGACVW